MSFVFLGATGDHAGRSLITWVIARRLVEKGVSVGFLKPFGTDPIRVEGIWTDRDVYLFKEILNLEDPLEKICPYLISEQTWEKQTPGEILGAIQSLGQKLSKRYDLLLVMGSKHVFFDEALHPVSDTSLILALNAKFVLVDRFRDTSKSIYSILSVSSLLKGKVKGIILNRVPPEKLEEIRIQVIPSLAKKGIPLAVAISEDPVLSYRSLEEIMDILGGEVLCGGESLAKSVGAMTVGSADLKGELRLFKRAYNKIILLEPSSHDKEAEGPPTQRSIAAILLTGGRDPAPQILEVAKKANIPLILIKNDTFGALERLEQNPPGVSPRDESKIRHFTALMDRDGNLDRLVDELR